MNVWFLRVLLLNADCMPNLWISYHYTYFTDIHIQYYCLWQCSILDICHIYAFHFLAQVDMNGQSTIHHMQRFTNLASWRLPLRPLECGRYQRSPRSQRDQRGLGGKVKMNWTAAKPNGFGVLDWRRKLTAESTAFNGFGWVLCRLVVRRKRGFIGRRALYPCRCAHFSVIRLEKTWCRWTTIRRLDKIFPIWCSSSFRRTVR